MRARDFRVVGVIAAAGALTLAACGDDDDGGDGDAGGGEDAGAVLVVGTTDTVTHIDPPGEYDLPSNNIVDSLYQKLLTIPPGDTEPVPEAAESCDWDDDVTYTCTLKEGLQFSDGSELTAEDVVHSFERQWTIQHESGGWTLLNSINPDEGGGGVEAVDDLTVQFNLSAPDATFPYVLTTQNAASIVPAETPIDALVPDIDVVGSGPYMIDEFDPSQQIRLVPNENYTGDREVNNGGVILQKYDQASALKQAIEEGSVDVAFRSLTVTDTVDLQENGAERGVEVIEGQGTEINYMVLQTGRDPLGDVAVRQAIAQVIDRETIADSIYQGTVTPLYGPIPEGIPGHVPAFQEMYGEPDVEAAEQILSDAGIETPVAFDLWWMPDRYGEEIGDMYAEIERQLEDTGLFDVTLEQESWESYSETFADGTKDAFDLGWFPDYPDSSTYLTGFYSSEDRGGNFLNAGYGNDEMDSLLDEIATNTNQDERVAAAERASEIVAEDVPIIQLWQRNQLAYVREGVEGVEDTLDPSYTFRFYMVSVPGE